MRIKNQVYFISIFSSLLPIIILAATMYGYFDSHLRSLEKEKVRLVLLQGENHLERMFQDLESRVNILASLSNNSNIIEVKEYMDFFSDESNEIEYFAFGSKDGEMHVGKKAKDNFPHSYDPRKRPWYAGALRSKDFYVSEIFQHALTNEPIATVSKKVIKNGEVEGVIVGLLKLDGLRMIFDKFKTDSVEDFFLLDKYGQVLINSHEEAEVTTFLEENFMKLLQEGTLVYNNMNEQERLYKHHLNNLGLILVGGSSTIEFLKPIHSLKRIFLLLITTAFLSTVLLTLIFGRKLSQSIKRLAYIIDNISRGNYSKNMIELEHHIGSNSELFLVKEAIRKMQKEIKARENQLKRISQLDPLTQIYNKEAINQMINMEIKRSNDFITEFSLIMFDLDHFKDINDTYGHLFGDDVLKGICKNILEDLKSSDIFGRYGGEEFLVILPDTNLKDAMSIAERLREKIFQIKWSKNIKVSASFGVVAHERYSDSNELITLVDQALYKAKRKGRNRVESLVFTKDKRNPLTLKIIRDS